MTRPRKILRIFAAMLVLQAPSSSALVVQRPQPSQTALAQTGSLRDSVIAAGSNFLRRVAHYTPMHLLQAPPRTPGAPPIQDAAVMTPGEAFGTLAIWAVLTCIVAYFFHKNKATPEVESELDNDEERGKLTAWKAGAFTVCMEDPKVCVFSTCCPAIRWAHSMDMAGILRFWSAFMFFYLLSVINAFTAATFFWIGLAAYCTYYRQALRKRFDMEQSGWVEFGKDFCCYAFCNCLMVAQEAIQIDAAARCGHKAVRRESKETKEEVAA